VVIDYYHFDVTVAIATADLREESFQQPGTGCGTIPGGDDHGEIHVGKPTLVEFWLTRTDFQWIIPRIVSAAMAAKPSIFSFAVNAFGGLDRQTSFGNPFRSYVPGTFELK